ncbi:DUF58 domain-containing protein [Thermogladius sp.]|uniref:DUF58 domain-containing protein n=1 Tax=Thermogladius sp. TaxID=2023064 RepID=UPI003D1417C3
MSGRSFKALTVYVAVSAQLTVFLLVLLVERDFVRSLVALVLASATMVDPAYTSFTTFTSSLLCLSLDPLCLLAKAVSSAVSVLAYKSSPGSARSGFTEISVFTGIFTPIYILTPINIVSAFSALSTAAFRLGLVQFKLSKIDVIAEADRKVVELGGEARIRVRAEIGESAWYEIRVGDNFVRRGLASGPIEYEYVARATRIGLVNMLVKARFCDSSGFACIEKPAVKVKFKVVPKFRVVSERALAYLRRALRETPSPLILVRERALHTEPGVPLGGATGAGVGRSLTAGQVGTGSQLAPGEAGAGYAGSGFPLRGELGEWSGEAITAGDARDYYARWRLARRVYILMRRLFSGFYGEYIGCRDYIPGDPPRRIHWKKSASKGKLVVKEFSRGDGGGVAGGSGGLLIVADWVASNYEELDSLVLTTLSLVWYVKDVKESLYIYLRTPSLREYFISGSPLESLAGLISVLRSEELSLNWDFSPVNSSYKMVADKMMTLEEPFLVVFLRELHRVESSRIYEEFKRLVGDTKTPYIIINGTPTMLKYDFLRFILESHGLTAYRLPEVVELGLPRTGLKVGAL